MLPSLLHFAALRLRRPSLVQLLHALVKARRKADTAARCTVEDELLQLQTSSGKVVRFSEAAVLAQLERLPAEVVVPAILDLAQLLDPTDLVISRFLWARYTSGEVGLFRFHRKRKVFKAVTAAPLKARKRFKSSVQVVKDSQGRYTTTLHLTPALQAALVEVLRGLLDHQLTPP